MGARSENLKMVGKLAVVTIGMFAFGYVLIPIYKHICEMTGINILSLSERQVPGNGTAGRNAQVPANSQVDATARLMSSWQPFPVRSRSASAARMPVVASIAPMGTDSMAAGCQGRSRATAASRPAWPA